jgi:hypothetical protein
MLKNQKQTQQRQTNMSLGVFAHARSRWLSRTPLPYQIAFSSFKVAFGKRKSIQLRFVTFAKIMVILNEFHCDSSLL